MSPPRCNRAKAGRAVNGGLDSPDRIGMAERLAATVAAGNTITIDAAGHYPTMERPDAYNRTIGAFLRSL